MPDFTRSTGISPSGTSGKELQRSGDQWLADLNTDSTHDIRFSEDRLIQNFYVWFEDWTSGDWIELQVYLPGETPTAVLPKLAEKLYVPPGGFISELAEGIKDVSAGIILRFTYHSTATTGNQPRITLHMRAWIQSTGEILER